MLERASFVCCDSREQAKIEAGDLVEPVERGVLDWLEVHELLEVVSGELTGRQSDEDIVLFKSLGIAAEDLAVGKLVLDRARERGRRARSSSLVSFSRASAAVFSPIARMTSGRSSRRRRCSSVVRFFRYGSSMISVTDRPDLCSRMTYAPSASSFEIARGAPRCPCPSCRRGS